jgi:nucleoid DNA-binding protein
MPDFFYLYLIEGVRMATAKKVTVKKATPVKKLPVKAALTVPKPIKTGFTKAALITYLAQQAGVEPKAAKAFLTALEETILASVNRKGLGEFTLPGLLKITAQKVPAKKKRFGKDPFSGEERWFDAKPASIRIRARALKKLKDAAL